MCLSFSGGAGGGNEWSPAILHHYLFHHGALRPGRGRRGRVRPLEGEQPQAILLRPDQALEDEREFENPHLFLF